MKKKVSLFLVVLLTFSLLVGCNNKDTSSTGEAKGGDKAEYKVAMVANAPIADGGWNTSAYEAMQEAAKEMGFETTYSENVAQTDYVSTFREYAIAGYDLIFAPGNEFTDAVKEVAKDFPDVNFAILNGDEYSENIASLLPNNKQIGFIAGALAAMKTETNSVAFVGGMEITPTVTMLEYFEKGAKEIKPDVKVSSAYAGSFDDTAKGKEIAISLISTNDADVFYGHASAIDKGVREGLETESNRWSIAQPSDFLDDDPEIILTSIVTSNTQLLKLAMEDVKNDTYGGKIIEGTLDNDVVTIGRFGKSLDENIQKEFTEFVEKVKSGEITVE
ncbi:MAG: BMP family protein [Miniphocaeibacter sp.]|uniref:BMP family protein n=1 Tax=Miniphocaeibacter sp. TaxID=3100973 RepID=UPI0018121BDF|nr:BMP family ABC transporter substrate-binding protein [Gallicola sp.]